MRINSSALRKATTPILYVTLCAVMRVIIKTNTYFIPRFEVAEQYNLSCERFA